VLRVLTLAITAAAAVLGQREAQLQGATALKE
jgi:hypothetical protein